MKVDVTRTWLDILTYNKIECELDDDMLNLVNLTTNKTVATGKTPSKLLDAYFAKQLKDMNRDYFQEARY